MWDTVSVETELYPISFNKKDDISTERWKPLTCSLKECRNFFSRDIPWSDLIRGLPLHCTLWPSWPLPVISTSTWLLQALFSGILHGHGMRLTTHLLRLELYVLCPHVPSWHAHEQPPALLEACTAFSVSLNATFSVCCETNTQLICIYGLCILYEGMSECEFPYIILWNKLL